MSAKRRHPRKSNTRKNSEAPKRSASGPTSGARLRRLAGRDEWELVLPRCARDRAEDLEEVRKMLEAGELDVAHDECLWLLSGCAECLEAHRILGEIALSEDDLHLARGHFGYAFRIGQTAIEREPGMKVLPYHLPANQAFHESGTALAWCLMELGKSEMAQEVVALLLRCDPEDPLGAARLLSGKQQPPDVYTLGG